VIKKEERNLPELGKPEGVLREVRYAGEQKADRGPPSLRFFWVGRRRRTSL